MRRPIAPLLLCALAVLAGPAAAAPSGPAGSISGPGTVPLRGSVHPLAQPRFDLGRVSGETRLRGLSLVLAPTAAQQADLEKLLADQQDPSSPSYHQWLTPEQYADRFAPGADAVAEVAAWLRSQGFTVDSVSRSRTRVFFSGTAARVEAAFGTELHHYLVNGERHLANATEPRVPAALAGRVLGLRHLDDFRLKPRSAGHVRHPLAPRFTSSVTGDHFLAPADFATIYDLKRLYSAGLTGAGQSIAVIGQTAIDPSDQAAFRAASGLSPNGPQLVLVPNSGTSTIQSGDVDEANLDVEWSGAVAPDARVIFVYTGSDTSYGALDALQYAIDQKLAPVISISYGDCEPHFSATESQTLRQMLQQANAQGQTISTASGDYGAADCETGTVAAATTGETVDLPSGTPEVTSVGGTNFTGDVANPSTYWSATNDPQNGSALQYIPGAAWNDTYIDPANPSIMAGGGGASSLYPKPSWQNGFGPADGQRDVPDLALAASPEHDGYLFCSQGSCVNGYRDSTGGLDVVGGTSAGAPAFAGFLALLNQAKGGAGLGNVNPTLYALAGSTPAAFRDITSGDNIVPCQAGSTGCPSSGQFGYTAVAGYDQVTGLGVPDGYTLLAAWPGATTTVSDFGFVSSGSSLTVTQGQAGQVTLTVTPLPASFSQTVSFSCAGLPAGATCSFSPPRVTPSGAAVASTLSIQTTTLTAGLLRRPLPRQGGGLLALVLPGALGLAGARRRRRWALAAGAALLAASLACGGGGGTGKVATPRGTSTVTVTATSGGSPSVIHQLPITLTVQ